MQESPEAGNVIHQVPRWEVGTGADVKKEALEDPAAQTETAAERGA